MKHKHHITPKHLGGTDDPSNLVYLTISGHAAVHLWMHEEYGRWQDQLAYLGLSKMIGKEEITRIAQSKSGKDNLGRKHSEETKRKISAAQKGKKISEETLEKMRGRKQSFETRKKISDAQKGEKHHNYGKKASDETKLKMSLSQKGRKHSEETKRKIGNAQKP